MIRIALICCFCVLANFGRGQNAAFNFANVPIIDEELNEKFFADNRDKLRDTMPDSVIVAMFSAPIKSKSNDVDYPYHQDSDFYYFTGVNEPNALLLIFKTPKLYNGQQVSEVLFVEEKNNKKEKWSGKMLGVNGASEMSAISMVLPNTMFKTLDLPFDSIQYIYHNQNQFIERDDKTHGGDLMSLQKHLNRKAENAEVGLKPDEAEDLFGYLRQSKADDEIRMLQRAVDITCDAHKRAIEQIRPGMTEYQVEALIEYTFRANGADGTAFPSIVASGENGGIMHYTSNSSLLIPGDMMVIDIGAQYQGYAADVTRTIPVSGVFTEEQKIIYQIVLDAQTAAIRYATAGYKFWTPHEEAMRAIGKGLIKHGIIQKWSDIGKYFIHGTSHYLGLDVHDVGIYSALKPGEVITVEPGIYIPKGSPCDPKWWGIFVRIEDDILITEGPARVMSASAPKSISEIESLMNKHSENTKN